MTTDPENPVEPAPTQSQTKGAPQPEAGNAASVGSGKSGRPISGLRRDLTQEHLKEEGTQRMLLGDLDRLERENDDLRGFRDRYYTADKNCEVSNTKLSGLKARWADQNGQSILSSVCFTTGGAILSFSAAVYHDKALFFSSLIIAAGTIIAAAVTQLKSNEPKD